MEQVACIMQSLRDSNEKTIADSKIVRIRDYKSRTIKDFSDGSVSQTTLPVSDVLYYELDNGCSVIVRPSGTEPKVKLYVLTTGNNKFECNDRISKYVSCFSDKLK